MATRKPKLVKASATEVPSGPKLAGVIAQAAVVQLEFAKLYQALLEIQSSGVNGGDASEGIAVNNTNA